MMENDKDMKRGRKLAEKLRGKEKVRILFVCLGNICRSPAAQGVMQAVVDGRAANPGAWELDSAGTGNYHVGDLPDKRMRVHAARRGYSLTHAARQFRPVDFDNFDMIVTMDHSNLRNVMSMARTTEDCDKVVPMAAFVSRSSRYDHIPDPYYEGAEGFELVLDLLEDGTNNLYNIISGNENLV